MPAKDKILIVEDEKGIAGFISAALNAAGYDTLLAATAAGARSMISSHCPELVILDLGLPDGDGLTVLQAMRKWTQTPVLVVSARSHERDKVEALDAGADDYITKPFGTAELLARVRTALRHVRTATDNPELARTGVFKSGELEVDFGRHLVRVRGDDARLTQNEYKLVSLLALHAGRVLTYDYIMKQLWGPGAHGDNQILRVNMANIRRKIEQNPAEPRYIFTEVGVGYRMADAD